MATHYSSVEAHGVFLVAFRLSKQCRPQGRHPLRDTCPQHVSKVIVVEMKRRGFTLTYIAVHR